MKNKQKSNESKIQKNPPLFTGNYTRDTVIADIEKAAEVSQAIYETIAKKRKNKKK